MSVVFWRRGGSGGSSVISTALTERWSGVSGGSVSSVVSQQGQEEMGLNFIREVQMRYQEKNIPCRCGQTLE